MLTTILTSDFGKKFIGNFASAKFAILLLASYFFYTGKLTEATWEQMALFVAGARTITDLAALAQGVGGKNTPAAVDAPGTPKAKGTAGK